MHKADLMVKAYNLLKASYKRAKGGFKDVDQVTYYDRVHTCTRCPKFDYVEYECTVCGCPIETKAKWKTESCPKNKWNEVK